MKDWDYRVLRSYCFWRPCYTIHRVFYKNGKPDTHTQDAITPFSTSLERLNSDLSAMRKALEKPVLDSCTYKEV